MHTKLNITSSIIFHKTINQDHSLYIIMGSGGRGFTSLSEKKYFSFHKLVFPFSFINMKGSKLQVIRF